MQPMAPQKSEKKAQANTHTHTNTSRKNGIQASSETKRATCNMPPTAMFWLQRAAARRGRSAARQINARCMQTSCQRVRQRQRGRGEREQERERALTSALVRLFAVSASVCRRQQRHRALWLLLSQLLLLFLLHIVVAAVNFNAPIAR